MRGEIAWMSSRGYPVAAPLKTPLRLRLRSVFNDSFHSLFPVQLLCGTADGQKLKKLKKDPAAVFQALDKNKDGKVSKEEFMANKKGEWAAQGKKNFAGKDKDSDGFLTIEEFSAKRQK